jgi:hypothetical protein
LPNTNWDEVGRKRMGDWRQRAKHREWHCIIVDLLSDEDCDELFAMLNDEVPQRTWGDGLETYPDYIRPHEAKSVQIGAAARLLWEMRNFPRTKYSRNFERLESPFRDARRLAHDVLYTHDVVFEGWQNTYFYWQPRRKIWLQIKGKRREIIVQKRKQIQDRRMEAVVNELDFRQLLRAERAWMSAYPWRRCQSLAYLWRFDHFEPFTPLWHALQILGCHSGFREEFSEETRYGQGEVSPKAYAGHLLRSVEIGIQIGTSYEALKRKRYEEPAIKHMDRIKYSSTGGKERGKQFEPERQLVLGRIRTKLDSGKRITTALRLVAAENLKVKKYNADKPSHEKEYRRVHGIWYRNQRKL